MTRPAVLVGLMLLITQGLAAQELKQVVYAAGDPAVSVATAPYTSLQQATGLAQRLAGVEVKVQPTAGATAAAQAVSAGNAFYSTGGLTSLVTAAQQDPNLVIVAFDAGNFYRVVVPEGSPVQTVSELKGKTIGTQSLGAAAYLFGLAVVADAGLDPQRDVRWIPIGVGAQAAHALGGGMVDAYAGYDNPNTIIGLLLGKPLRILPSPLNDLKGMSGMLVTRTELAKYPNVVLGLCRALYTSYLFAKANPEATVRNHWRVYPEQRPSNMPEAQALREGEEVLEARLASAALPGADGLYGYQPIADMQRTADVLFHAGLLKTRADMAKITDQRFKEQCGRLDEAKIAAAAKAWKVP